MSLTRRVARALPPAVRHSVLNVAVHRDLYLSPLIKRDNRPIALVYGNCQAEALRRILATHEAFSSTFQLLRVPPVHEISSREMSLIEARLPEVEVLIGQEVRADYRGMRLGTEQLAQALPASARVLRYPVAYFEGMFPFQVYVNRHGNPIASAAPITDYHDLRTLFAAGEGWDQATTLRRLGELKLDPTWVQDNAERSLAELAERELQLDVRLCDLIRSHPTTSFNTINHPVNSLVTEVARQVLEQLGYLDADQVLGSRQSYLDHISAPRESQIVQALGADPEPGEREEWRTEAGVFSPADVLSAHLKLYADDPELLAEGLRKHQDRLATLATMWH